MSDAAIPLGRHLRRPGSPGRLHGFRGVQVDDARLEAVLAADAPLLVLHEGAIHSEGTVWQAGAKRLLWSDVPNRRLNAWYGDGRVEVVMDATAFMNGNTVAPDGSIWHCEHGRRCISRSPAQPGDGDAEPVVTHYRGARLNSPNDIVARADGTIWFTDPSFGILMPGQGALAEPELDHRSLYRFDPATSALDRMADFEQPNGLAFAPDGASLYVTDTSLSNGEAPGHTAGRTHDVLAFDVGADSALSNRRLFCRTDHGVPDGIKVDRRGWLWVTAADGVHVWAPERRRLGFIPLPQIASNLCFGGEDGRRLFIAATTSLYALDLREPG